MRQEMEKCIFLIDDPDRENEGDLNCPCTNGNS